MKAFIENLLPRLKQFSSSLERQEVFVDAPWVVVDEEMNQQKYIFRRNGDLIMSLNGQVTIGKWEYLESAQSLLIDRIQDKILLNQKFVHPAVMILNMDGLGGKLLVLANESLLPNLNVSGFLKLLEIQNGDTQNLLKFAEIPDLTTIYLSDGSTLQLLNFKGRYETTVATKDGLPVEDCIAELKNKPIRLLIEKSVIQKELHIQDYITRNGVIQIEHRRNHAHQPGDRVFTDGKLAPDGRYRLDFFLHINVKDGRII